MRTLMIATLALAVAAATAAHEPSKSKAEAKSTEVKDWKKDEACRLVFFAVLQGLYEDGVSDEVVNSIVPPDKKGRDKMRHSFVLGCPLCLPTYEAFRAYQSRPRFLDEAGPASLGKGLPAEEVKGLMSLGVSGRVGTLRRPIKRWVEARLVSMKLDEGERARWWADIAARSGQGTATLGGLMAKDPWYKNWSGYWGCAACKGSEDACRELRRAGAGSPRK